MGIERHYVRVQPGEIWHILDPLTRTLLTLCGKPMGTNPKEKHSDSPKGRVCLRCWDESERR